jgi:hypothetical protein
MKLECAIKIGNSRLLLGGFIMNQAGSLRYFLAVALLIIIAGLYFSLHPLSQRLLSPPPGAYVPVLIVLGGGIAIFASMTLFAHIPSRLVRRLATTFILAVTLYACGESGRGLYAITAFRGAVTSTNELWHVNNFGQQDNAIGVSRPGLNRTFSLAASPEAVAAASGFGHCVNVRVERSQSGVERLASRQGPLTAADLTDCSPTTASVLKVPQLEESADQQVKAMDADRAKRTENPGGEVSFEPGQPMIDTSQGE